MKARDSEAIRSRRKACRGPARGNAQRLRRRGRAPRHFFATAAPCDTPVFRHARDDVTASPKGIKTMQLMRRTWDPMAELESLTDRFNRLFPWGRTNGEKETMALAQWAPSVNISETDTEYRIRAELPAVKKEDVKVKLENGILTIQGDRKEEKEEKGVKFHRRELFEGHFLRQFTMPDDADEAKVDAKFKDGVLDVVITKNKSKTAKAKEIAIQ
jgi:HSP20 family protein